MNIKEFEELILAELQQVVEKIIRANLTLGISAKARVGAEISEFLQTQFVEYTKNHGFFKKSESASSGTTKNPWDAKTFFQIGTHLEEIWEEIWIDFKALKVSSADSNPDIGTPDKIIKLIQAEKFYLVYIFVYYQENGNGLEFVQDNGHYTKIYFLKDISDTVRVNPKPQLQVNKSAPSTYRTREEFIELLLQKMDASYHRQIKKAGEKLKELGPLKNQLIARNKSSENRLKKFLDPS